MSGKATAEEPRKKGHWTSGFGAILIGTFCLVLIGMVAYFNLKNRKSMAHILKADVDFISAPQTVDPGGTSRFVIQVAQDKGEKPLAGRVLDVTVTPSGKAEILAIGGDAGRMQAASGARAKGRTDESGRMEISVRAAEPGRYTLVALDSASGKGETVNFRAVAPEG